MAVQDEPYDVSVDFPVEELKEKFVKNNKKESKEFKIKKFRFALSKRQREELLSVAGSHSRLHYLMIKTQLETGLRVGELVNLRIDDVRLNEKIVVVNAHEKDTRVARWNPKTMAGSRIIPVNPDLHSDLSGYIKGEKRKLGYFFVSQKGSGFKKESVIGFINKYAREARSINHLIGSHAMRRTFASYLLDQNEPIGRISKLLGHASIEITMRYLFQIDALDGYDEIGKKLGKMNK